MEHRGRTSFWGCVVEAGCSHTFDPPSHSFSKLHLSQAALPTDAKPNSKATLEVKTRDSLARAVVTLRAGKVEHASIDLVIDEQVVFLAVGDADIHLTGYHMPEFEDEGEDYSEEDSEMDPYEEDAMGVGLDGEDYSEDSEDYSDEDSDEFSSDDESDLEAAGEVRRPTPEIRELPADAGEDDVDASDDTEADDEELDEDESDDEDESGEEEEEEEEEKAAAPTPGQKRKEAAAPVAQPLAKQAKQAQQAKEAKQVKQAKQAQVTKQPAAQTVAKQAAQPVAKAPVRAETAKPAKEAKKRTFPNGFEIEVLKQGLPDAKFAKAGKTVSVKYTGRLKSSGKVFDATKGNRAFNFRLGVGEVIKGWDRGVEGMRIGDKRRLIIPPAMAYGTSGAGKAIPPNAWLDFEVELVNVK